MMEREARLVAFKFLDLITPRLANRLSLTNKGAGESFEGPVFISQGIKKSERCEYCQVEYGPLAYHLDVT